MNTKKKILEKAQEQMLEKGYGNVSLTVLEAAVKYLSTRTVQAFQE